MRVVVVVMSRTRRLVLIARTTKTPLWRGGPAGPKSLCNACGIRYRKKRSVMRLEKGPEKKREKTTTINTTTATDISTITTATTTNHSSGC
ncbi:hypothetical protein NC652_012697 [Populus alba x Populus x berolinensis]|nr:hypothetical protein NC652_012697 [Populus alba x Populus x berolinensis]